MREFAFELAMCAAVERDSDGLIARQLGTHTRIVDAVEVLPGTDFEERIDLTPETIPALAIESDVGVGRARYWKDAIDAAPDRARAAVERALEVGFFETEHRNGQRYVRQTVRYPEWFDRLRAFENKPDLGRPGDLQLQLRKDVSLALFDEVVLVTESYVTGAHLNRIPPEVGVWRFDADDGTFRIVREATTLPTEEPGIAVLEENPARVDIEPTSAERKRRLRRRVAERAYGKGWRPDTMPACASATACGPEFRPADELPYCEWKGRFVDPTRECGTDCAGHAAADPPAFDPETTRAEYSPWDPDPEGVRRRQASLERFSE